MRYALVSAFFLLSSCALFAQHQHDYTWLFGDLSVEIGDERGASINFLGMPIESQAVDIFQHIRISSSHISDAFGNLLFYTDGCRVRNNQDEEIAEMINFGGVYQVQCFGTGVGYTAGPQSTVWLPQPGNDSIYYLFHKRIFYGTPNIPVHSDRFLYSVFDASETASEQLIDQNQFMHFDTFSFGKITAVKHLNGADWWVTTPLDSLNQFYTFLFTDQGVEEGFLNKAGSITAPFGDDGGGQANFSPDGSQYAVSDPFVHVLLYDFDRETGLFSNQQQLFLTDSIYSKIGGVAFSPSGRFLYVAQRTELYQFDLEADDIQGSRVLIDIYDGFASPFATTFYLMQQGPDCRIYMNSTNGVDYLHVIHHPNRKGKACGFRQHDFKLANDHNFTLPYFPNFRLDTNEPFCDSTLAIITGLQDIPDLPAFPELLVYPNPTSGQITIEFPEPVEADLVLTLFNDLGRQVKRQVLSAGQQQYLLSMEDLARGVYFFEVWDGEGSRGNGRVVKVE